MKTKFEKYRMLISRLAATVVMVFLLCTQSKFEGKDEMLASVLFLVGIVLVAGASLGRMWCSLYIAGYKNNTLITQGPYSLCRNPLYFFSLMGLVGIGCATETFTFPIVFVALFASYYGFVIKSEENRLRHNFGAVFEAYEKRVPAFFPKFSSFDEPENYNVKPRVFRAHIASALLFIWMVGLLEMLEGLREMGVLPTVWTVY